MSLNAALVIFGVLLLAGCSRAPSHPAESASPQPQPVVIGGEPVVTLERRRSPSSNSPEFLSVQVLPGRGMNVFQVRAFVPGKGDINLIASPLLEDAAKTL